MGRTKVTWVIQSSSFFHEWENPIIGCLFLVPSFLWCRVLNGDGPSSYPPRSCHYRIYGLHAPVVKLACGILLPQACGCLELCIYISRATVWKSREQTDSKEFVGQDATASSLEDLFSACYRPYLGSYGASGFMTFISLVRCFHVGFSVRNPCRRGVYMKRWGSGVCLTQGTSETSP